MALPAGEKASERNLEKGKLVVGDEPHEEEAADDPQPSNLHLKKRKRLEFFLRPFEKDELLDLLVQIGTKFPAATEEIRDAVNANPQSRRLFVGSLNPMTTQETLCAAFSSFGEIEQFIVVLNPETGKSLCYGFITFKNCESAKEAVENPPRMNDCNLVQCHPSDDRHIRLSRKIHVSGLSQDVSTETLLNHFSKYGEIEECLLIRDIEKNRSNGYGFVTFKTIEGAKQANRDPEKFIRETSRYVGYSESMPRETETSRIMPSEGPSSRIMHSEGPSQRIIPSEGPSPRIMPSEGPSPRIMPSEGPSPLIMPPEGPSPLPHRHAVYPYFRRQVIMPSEGPSPRIMPSEGPSPSIMPSEGPSPRIMPSEGPSSRIMPSEGPSPHIMPSEGPSPLPPSHAQPQVSAPPHHFGENEAYPCYLLYAIGRPHHFGVNEAYPYNSPYAIAIPHRFGHNEAYPNYNQPRLFGHPYYRPHAVARPQHFGANEAYGMWAWGRPVYPYH